MDSHITNNFKNQRMDAISVFFDLPWKKILSIEVKSTLAL